MVRSALVLALLAAAPAVAGCAHRVAVTSDPAGAYVSLGGERVGVTPAELAVPFVGPRVLRVELTGYRPLEVRLAAIPARSVELRLVPDHGAAGTWEPGDVR